MLLPPCCGSSQNPVKACDVCSYSISATRRHLEDMQMARPSFEKRRGQSSVSRTLFR